MKKIIFLPFALILLSCAKESVALDSSSKEEASASVPEKEAPSFRLLSWNVYLGRGNMDYVVEIVTEKNPDIIHFQECTVPCDAMKKQLLDESPDYVLIDDQVNNILCATPIIFDSSRFNLLESGTEMLVDAYPGVTTKSLAWAVFEEKESEKILIDLNFHGAVCTANYDGYEDYTDEERQAIAAKWREGNAKQLMAKAEELKLQFGEAGVCFSGDCNFDEDSKAYQAVMEGGYFDAETTATDARCQDGLKSSHTLAAAPNEGKTIDHVFADGNLWLKTHGIERGAKALKASDHCPVIADILMEEAPYA